MRVIILGSGQVGGTLAQNLAIEDNDVTLIDNNEQLLQKLKRRLDIQTVLGCASHPETLLEAGIEQADMLIAVTNSDEVNIVACFIAQTLFQTPTKIARIRAQNYYLYPDLFAKNAISIDVCISPERLVTEHIANLIKYPGTSQILQFAFDKIMLITIRIGEEDGICGASVQQISDMLGNLPARLLTVMRNKVAENLQPDLVLNRKDSVCFVVDSAVIIDTLKILGCFEEPNKRIIIAGGGHIGRSLALLTEKNYQVKIIDHNPNSTINLAESLDKATVLDGDIADKDLLLNENIEFTDVFCALTNDDDANIMGALQAKKLGVRYSMALVNRDAYVDLIDDSMIDYAISPQLITIGSILTRLRRGNMVKVQRLQFDEAEGIELIIQGSPSTSQVIGRKISEITLPQGCIIAAVLRNQEVLLAEDDLVFADKDHVIILLLRRRSIRQVEALFQVNLSFMS